MLTFLGTCCRRMSAVTIPWTGSQSHCHPVGLDLQGSLRAEASGPGLLLEAVLLWIAGLMAMFVLY